MVILTIVFALIGWGIRKRYKVLEKMINDELGEETKVNK